MIEPALTSLFQKTSRLALLIAIWAAVFCVIGAAFDHAQFFQSWLAAWLFFTGLSLGSLVIVMMQAVTGGAWGLAIRRPAEAAMLALPFMALLFVPVLIGAHDLFPWVRANMLSAHQGWHYTDGYLNEFRRSVEDWVLDNSAWQQKHGYLSLPFFTARAFAYFAVLGAFAFFLRRQSLMQDKDADSPLPARLSAGGLVAYVLCMNLASTDWVMSLEPGWYSTIFVIIFMAGQFLSALALMTAFVAFFGGREPFSSKLTAKHFADLGNMLLAFVVFWIYVSFSQFLIIWSGNLPKEISWYLHRSAASWKGVALFLMVFQFFIPFALLLLRTVTRKRERLRLIAIVIVFANFATIYWHVAPAFHPDGVHVHWLDFAALLCVGGFWTAAFFWFLKKAPLWPIVHAGEAARLG